MNPLEAINSVNPDNLKKGWNDIMPFGMFKGATFAEIRDFEPSYLVWVYDNIESMEFISEIEKQILIEKKRIIEDLERQEENATRGMIRPDDGYGLPF